MGRTVDEARHRRVLDVATEVIRRKGVDGASMTEIADAVGISKSTLFHYFPSKSELVERLQERLYEIARGELTAAAADPGATPTQRLRVLVHIHAHHCVERLSSPVLAAFVQQWGPTASPQGQAQVRARRRYETLFEETFSDAVAAGELEPRDPRLTSLGLLGMSTWMAMWFRPGVDPPLHEVVDGLLDSWMTGLRRSSPGGVAHQRIATGEVSASKAASRSSSRTSSAADTESST